MQSVYGNLKEFIGTLPNCEQISVYVKISYAKIWALSLVPLRMLKLRQTLNCLCPVLFCDSSLPKTSASLLITITGLLNTSTRWVWSTSKLLHCHCSLSSAAVDKSKQHGIWTNLGMPTTIQPGMAGREARKLPLCYAVPQCLVL